MLLTGRDAWKKLVTHAEGVRLSPLSQENKLIATDTITLDYSAQQLDNLAFELLIDLANECWLKEWIEALMTGYPVNQSEGKPALHTALRRSSDEPLFINDVEVVQEVLAVREQMRVVSQQLRGGEWLGHTGKPITDVVNLGIGGSQLGPQLCLDAFCDITIDTLRFHFIADMDANAFRRATKTLNPETTLFIISSKSFTTQETLDNAKRALSWVGVLNQQDIDQHFIAVTAFPHKAKQLGFNQVLPIWDWVGGRYSFCSAINLITCIAIGFESFIELLEGAKAMDEHFRHADLAQNMPVVLALLGIWNINFLHINNLLLLTYAQSLQWFVPFIQQMDMESNGKSLDKQGRAVNYSTAPIVWGGLGNQAQHSYYQLLCQGTHRIAADLISMDSLHESAVNRLCFAHKKILSQGHIEENNPNSYIPGNTPVNHLRLNDCSPRTIGSLIALYEHKLFVQGLIWNINSFDQPAVESSKQMLRSMSKVLA